MDWSSSRAAPPSHGRLRLIGAALALAVAAGPRPPAAAAMRLRLALQELGPVFVKFGQAISTRRDLLPPDIADELVKLQDQVPPFAGEIARQIAADALGKPLEQLFRQLRDRATGRGVHRAGACGRTRRMAAKSSSRCCGPACARSSRATSRCCTRWRGLARSVLRRRPSGCARCEIVREYEKTILDELDLMREAANAAHLKRNFAGDPKLHVPEVHWDLCRDQRDGDGAHPRRAHRRYRAAAQVPGRGFQALAENGVAIFFTQVFRHNFFHADMHPGNIFVLADDPDEPRYAAVDFGIMGTLDPRDQEYLAQNFLAVFDRDYRRGGHAARGLRLGAARHPRRAKWKPPSAPSANPSSTGR